MKRKIISVCLFVFVVLAVAYTIPTSASVTNKPKIDWYQINADGFGDPDNDGATLIKFDDNLYATTRNLVTGANIFRYQDGESWIKVTADGFGKPDNRWVSSQVVFNDELFLSTANFSGSEIWRTADGVSWESVVAGGFGDPSNGAVYAFGVFDDKLFAGTNNGTGGQLWYSSDGSEWLNANPDGFGEGNWGIWSIASFQGNLFVGVGGSPSIWKSTDGITWAPVITEEFSDSGNWIHGYAMKEYKNALYATTYNNATGVEVWRTLDGVTWSQVNSDGFGSSSNKGARMLFVLTL